MIVSVKKHYSIVYFGRQSEPEPQPRPREPQPPSPWFGIYRKEAAIQAASHFQATAFCIFPENKASD
jgi:hypothetical protein